MHWSRLVDAPIAAIILVVTAVTGSPAAGETVALIAWPFVLYALALYLLLRIGRLAAGEEAMFPLFIIGGDHALLHRRLCAGRDRPPQRPARADAGDGAVPAAGGYRTIARPGLAGISAVLMLAIGMETVPYVAVGGLFVAGWFLIRGDEASGVAAGFGAAFAATSGAVFVATVPDRRMGRRLLRRLFRRAVRDRRARRRWPCGRRIDARAQRQLSRGARYRWRCSAARWQPLALVYFPQCLERPIRAARPMLQSYWLDAVGEAQPLWSILAEEPETAAGHYATVLIALVVLAFAHAQERACGARTC